MVYQLLKRDPVRTVAPFYILGCAVVYPLLGSSVGKVAFLSSMVGMGTAFTGFQRATRFQAGLPIAGRELLLTRVLSILGILWLPALAGGGTILAIGAAASAVTVMKVAAVCTLVIAALQSIRVRELTLPLWLFMSILGFLPVPSVWAATSFDAIPVLAVCLPLSTVLLLRVWWSTPKAYQLAPAGRHHAPATVQRAKIPSIASPTLPWWPVLHSTLSWQYVVLLPVLFVAAKSQPWIFTNCWVALLWQLPRQRSRWLWSLPINPRALLLTILAPILLALVGGWIAGPNTEFLNLTATLGWTLLLVLCLALSDWRRISRFPKWVRVLPALLSVGIPLLLLNGILFFSSPLATTKQFTRVERDLLSAISGAAPGGLLGAVVVTAAILAALYWAVEKVFREAEFTGKPLPPQDFEMFQR